MANMKLGPKSVWNHGWTRMNTDRCCRSMTRSITQESLSIGTSYRWERGHAARTLLCLS